MFTYKFAVVTYPFRTLIARACRAIVKQRKLKLIFVFGMSRCGTTFLAKALTLNHRNSCYIHEPVKKLMLKRFQEEETELDVSAFWRYTFCEEQKPVKVHFLVCTLLRYLVSRRPRSKDTVCIKPISMYDCMEEVAKALGGSILFISRHPCGRTESIIRQRQHVKGLGVPDIQTLVRMGDEWGRVHHIATSQFERHDGWLWVVFEILCRDPEGELCSLYRRLDLEWNDVVKEKIRRITTTESHEFYGTKRDSQSQIDKWHAALSSEQIAAIRAGCAPHIEAWCRILKTKPICHYLNSSW